MLHVLPPTFRPVNNLIWCKTYLMRVERTRNVASQLVSLQCCKTSYMFVVARFSVPLVTQRYRAFSHDITAAILVF